ncbi:MAG: LysE family transporter [Patescibacteria group bacterium]
MDLLGIFLTVALVHLLAVMSPGPDFVMLTGNTVRYSRRTGVLTAAGLGLGILVHVTYSLVGIGLLVSQSILLFTIIKYVGAAYLVYIGYKALRSESSKRAVARKSARKDISPRRAIGMGFITNVTNPKATLFFLSLFSVVISPGTPFWLKAVMSIEMSLVTFAWFALVAVVISHRLVAKRLDSVQHIVERAIGGVLILLGLRIATTASR